MPFRDTPTRAIVELDVEGRPVGRYQIEAHRTLDEDPGYVRTVANDITPEQFAAIFDNASVSLSGQLQAAQLQIAALQSDITAKDARIAADATLISRYKALDAAWSNDISAAIELHEQQQLTTPPA
jgi:hypothetical protein